MLYSDLSQNHCQNHCHNLPEEEIVCLAIVGIKTPSARPGVHEAVKRCLSAGIKVTMVTGDNIHTAKDVTRECGILTTGNVVDGPYFRKWSESKKNERIPDIQVIPRSLASDKFELVRHPQQLGEVVAVTGT